MRKVKGKTHLKNSLVICQHFAAPRWVLVRYKCMVSIDLYYSVYLLCRLPVKCLSVYVKFLPKVEMCDKILKVKGLKL